MRPDQTSGHEITVWKARPFLLLLAGFFVVMGLLYAIVGGLTSSWTHKTWPPRGPALPPQGTPAWNTTPPQLQTTPALDLEHLRALEFERLHTTRWVDSSHAAAVIPIERAMEMLAQAQSQNRLDQVLMPPKPATPLDLQNQKSTEAPKSP